MLAMRGDSLDASSSMHTHTTPGLCRAAMNKICLPRRGLWVHCDMGRRRHCRARSVLPSGAPRPAAPAEHAAGSCERLLALLPFTGGCRWCHGEIPPRRRTFCSAACVHEHKLRSNGRYMRDCVFRRDNGTCAICSIDTRQIGRAILSAPNRPSEARLRAAHSVPANRPVRSGRHGGAVFDVDHIVRVCDGGGMAGMGNLRTLCLACHRCVTWAASYSKKIHPA